MIEKELFIKLINNSKIFKENTKNNLINYFHILNNHQLDLIIQAIESEKYVILDFLKTLKNKDKIEFVDIKNQINSINIIQRVSDEKNDSIQKEIELENLINSLDNL